MSEPLGVEELRALAEHQSSGGMARTCVGPHPKPMLHDEKCAPWPCEFAEALIAAAPALLDEVDRLTEALEAAEENVQRLRYSKELRDEEIDAQAARAERAEADLADEKRRHAGLRAGVEALAGEWEWGARVAETGTLFAEPVVAQLRALLDTATEETQGAP